MPIYRLENVIQPYAWGSKTAIADLLGLPGPRTQPQAELWMGTHPNGPSQVQVGAERVSLQRLIEREPETILGRSILERFGPALPYLFKVLAAARPLSIQAHPSKQQAVAGFARENRMGVAMDAAHRNYRDANHKPEIICALTPFWALNGFRSAPAAADLLAPVCPRALEGALRGLKNGRETGLRAFFQTLLTLSDDERRAAAGEVATKAAGLADRSPVFRWMVALARAYPADMGVLSPALLNLIRLEPRQAMYLSAGRLHAYLEGVGIELMANSDNVLRGGLTPKHVDVAELLRVVQTGEAAIRPLEPEPVGPAESRYPSPAEEFSLGVIRPAEGRPYQSPSRRSVEILLCTEGVATLTTDERDAWPLKKGDSVLVPAALPSYRILGEAEIFKAAVPLDDQ